MNTQQLQAAYEKALAGWESNLRKVSQLETTIGDLRDEISRLNAHESVENVRLAARVAQLEADAEEVSAEDERGHKLIDIADGEELDSSSMATLAERVEVVLTERDTARAEVESLKDNYGAELSRALRRIENAEAEAESRKAELDIAWMSNKALSAEVESLKAGNAKLFHQNTDLMNEVDDLKAQLAEAFGHLTESRTKHGLTEAQLAEAQKELRADSMFRAPRLLERAETAEAQLKAMREALEAAWALGHSDARHGRDKRDVSAWFAALSTTEKKP